MRIKYIRKYTKQYYAMLCVTPTIIGMNGQNT